MEDRQERIREIAHRIWEEEGRPFGKEEVHWEKARQIVDMEDAERAALAPGNKGSSAKK